MEKFEIKRLKHCAVCNVGTMMSTGVPMGNYEDIFFCICDSCGYRDASYMYENLKHLTIRDPFEIKPKTDTNDIQTPK